MPNIFSMIFHSGEIAQLAAQIERHARQLNELPPEHGGEEGSVVSMLASSNLLLERYLENQKLQPKTLAPPPAAADRPAQRQEAAPPHPVKPPDEPQPVLVPAPATLIAPKEPDEGGPSPTAQELVKLRDWVLLAMKADGAPVRVFEGFYKRLGQILNEEGMVSLEETGLCNFDRQQVMDTEVTHDPQRDNHIAYTLRPGYLFREQIFRPQEVIVYRYEQQR